MVLLMLAFLKFKQYGTTRCHSDSASILTQDLLEANIIKQQALSGSLSFDLTPETDNSTTV